MKSIAIIIMVAAGLVGGCAGVVVDPKDVAELKALPYPESAPLGDDLRVIVVQHNGLLGGGTVKLTNITPRSYHDIQLWLNQQYVAKIKDLPVAIGGKSEDISLDQFIDKHGRPYPTGKFLKPELAFPIVLAEVFDPVSGRRHRLLVQSD